MAGQHRPSGSLESIAGGALVGLGLHILSGSLDRAAAQWRHLLGTTTGEVIGVLLLSSWRPRTLCRGESHAALIALAGFDGHYNIRWHLSRFAVQGVFHASLETDRTAVRQRTRPI